MPSWWMPASWAKALAPTMALLGWTDHAGVAADHAAGAVICVVSMPVSRLKTWRRVLSAMTTSSSEVLPARSPMPLMVTSTWRAPLCMPARVLAVASPRSLWQCTEMTTFSTPGVFSTDASDQPAELLGRGVAHRVGDVERGGAGLDGHAQHLVQELRVAAAGVLGRELDVGAQAAGIGDHLDAPAPTLARGAIFSLCFRWMSDVARKVWMRGRAAACTASQAASMSLLVARARPADHRRP